MATTKPDLTRVWANGAPPANVVDPDTTTPGKVNSGWQAEVPPFEHFNFLQKWFTQGLAHFNEQGIGVWDTDTTYPVDGMTKGSDGKIYSCVQEQNGNDPVSDDGTNWELWVSNLLSGQTDFVFSSVNKMKSLELLGGDSLSSSLIDSFDLSVKTQGYYGGWAAIIVPSGSAEYILTTLQKVRNAKNDPTWEPDGYGEHYVGVGTTYVAMLQTNGEVFVDWFGAKPDSEPDASINVTAIGECAKYCFEGLTQENAVPTMMFTGGVQYYINASIPIEFGHISMNSTGETRIRPVGTGSAYTCFDNVTSITERCFIDGLIFYMFDTFDGTNESFGLNSAFRFYRLSRNAYINIYCVGGDTGIDLATTQDHWGVNLGPMCRFELQKFPLRLDVNGQTFSVNGGLFNSTVKAGTDVTIIGNSSQVSFKGTVFENDGVNTSAAGGKMLRISGNTKEVIFDSCQSERLGYYADRTGAQGDYDVVIQGAERVTLINSRMWGGGYGSTAPGNSRNYGWWLEDCSIKLISSRLWSFSEVAINCVGDVSISCDSKSQIDGRIKGEFKVVSNADLGKNQIPSPDGSRYELSRTQPVPLGWRHLEATTTPQSALVTSGLSEQSSKHGFTFTDSTVYTNQIKVTQGDEICMRFFGEFAGSNCELFAYQFNPDGTIDLNNSNDPDTILLKSFTLNSTGAENGRAYFILKHVIDQDVQLVGFRFSRKTSGDLTNYIEAPSIYLNSGIDWKEDSAYSDNDSTFGFRFYLGPLLPALPNADLISAKTDIKGLYRQGELMSHQCTDSTDPLISTFDNTGDIDGTGINMVTLVTKP